MQRKTSREDENLRLKFSSPQCKMANSGCWDQIFVDELQLQGSLCPGAKSWVPKTHILRPTPVFSLELVERYDKVSAKSTWRLRNKSNFSKNIVFG